MWIYLSEISIELSKYTYLFWDEVSSAGYVNVSIGAQLSSAHTFH